MGVTLVAVFLFLLGASATCSTDVRTRVDCGFVGITQAQCQTMGCCWSPVNEAETTDTPWCFYQSETVLVNITVLAHYPDGKLGGQKLNIRGANCTLSWGSSIPMIKVATNIWGVNLTCPTGVIQLKTLLNAQWQIGANSFISTTGVKNGYVADVYPWFQTQTGSWGVVIKNLWSPQLNNSRSLVIYTPPSYNENTLKVVKNVLVMQDGQNLFDPSTSFGGTAWMCQDTVDSLVQQGSMEEIMIIGVYNTANRINEYTYSVDPEYGGGEGDLYLDFLEQTVMPWVEDRYRMDTGVSNLGIMGSSLGALISCYAGWTRSHYYGRAGCMSTSFWWNNEDFNNVILVNDSSPVPQELIYLDSGGQPAGDGDDYEETCRVRDHMEALGYVLNQDLWYFWDKGAQHNEYYWGKRFWVPMTDLYPIQTIVPHAPTMAPFFGEAY